MYTVDLYGMERIEDEVISLIGASISKILEYSVPPGYGRQQPPPLAEARPLQGSDRPDPGGRSIAAEEAASHGQTYL